VGTVKEALMKLITGGLLFALALCPALASADDKAASATPRSRAASNQNDDKWSDGRLVALLHHVNQEEIAAGKLAQEKGNSQAIKDYGRKLVKDHTRSDQDVLAAADKAGIKSNQRELTTHDQEEMRVDKKKMDQVKRLSGSEFDTGFAQVMSRDHDHMISMLRDAKKQVSAPMRELIDSTIPVLQEHKDLADKAAKSDSSHARTPKPLKR
jgi:putative membrane protein